MGPDRRTGLFRVVVGCRGPFQPALGARGLGRITATLAPAEARRTRHDDASSHVYVAMRFILRIMIIMLRHTAPMAQRYDYVRIDWFVSRTILARMVAKINIGVVGTRLASAAHHSCAMSGPKPRPTPRQCPRPPADQRHQRAPFEPRR